MNIALVGLVCFAANLLLGAAVWAAVDHEDQRFYRWYSDCPAAVSWLVQPLILTFWIVGLWLWWQSKFRSR